MTTTIMRDSIVGDDWIRRTMAANPIQAILDDKGQPTGNFSTGPVRLGWCEIDKLPPPKQGNENPKYNLQALFPPGTDFGPLYQEYYKQCAAVFPEYYDAQTQQYHGLHSPFRDQAEKLKYTWFTPGCTFIKFTSNFKPGVVDINRNPVLDMSKVYPGAWAICIVNAFDYGKNPSRPKKGISFGLQLVMLLGDDTKFGGGAPDAKKLLGGVQINATAPIARPNLQGAGMPAGAPAQPHVPQQHYVPQQGYVPAGAPAQPGYPPQPAYTPAAGAPYNPTDPDDDPSLYQ